MEQGMGVSSRLYIEKSLSLGDQETKVIWVDPETGYKKQSEKSPIMFDVSGEGRELKGFHQKKLSGSGREKV